MDAGPFTAPFTSLRDASKIRWEQKQCPRATRYGSRTIRRTCCVAHKGIVRETWSRLATVQDVLKQDFTSLFFEQSRLHPGTRGLHQTDSVQL
jgi:hypothetical protein